jgi:hypothetical protein
VELDGYIFSLILYNARPTAPGTLCVAGASIQRGQTGQDIISSRVWIALRPVLAQFQATHSGAYLSGLHVAAEVLESVIRSGRKPDEIRSSPSENYEFSGSTAAMENTNRFPLSYIQYSKWELSSIQRNPGIHVKDLIVASLYLIPDGGSDLLRSPENLTESRGYRRRRGSFCGPLLRTVIRLRYISPGWTRRVPRLGLQIIGAGLVLHRRASIGMSCRIRTLDTD